MEKLNQPSELIYIAGNDDAKQKIKGSLFGKDVNFLQPLVKGDNLTAAMVEITDQIGDLATRFDQFAKAQMKYNTSLSTHTHVVPFIVPLVAVPSIELIPAILNANIKQHTNCMATSWSQSKNLSNFRINYLYEYGDRWICSRFNRTT